MSDSRTPVPREIDYPCDDEPSNRRQMMAALGTLPVVGLTALRASGADVAAKVDGVSAPTRIVINRSDSDEYYRLRRLKLDDRRTLRKASQMPTTRIGDLEIGRLVCGSNLISMNMHARDLSYVKDLATHYNTEERIFMTLKKCEEHGVNSIVLKANNFRQFELAKYWSDWGGNMKWIADVITRDIDAFERLLVEHLELGASAAYVWGGSSDIWYHQGTPEKIIQAYEIIRKYAVPAGIAAHRIEPIMFCEREGLKPDFYMKTLHHDRYWSAHPKANRRFLEMYEPNSPSHDEYHDNMFCCDHEETVAFMQDVSVPWMAFKIMAAGAIPARDGFEYAFAGGADSVCVGMFDFQVETDVQLTLESIAKAGGRKRKWA